MKHLYRLSPFLLIVFLYNCSDPRVIDIFKTVITHTNFNTDDSNDNSQPTEPTLTYDGNTIAKWTFDECDGLTSKGLVDSSNRLIFKSAPSRMNTDFGKAVILEKNIAKTSSFHDAFPASITVYARVRLDSYPSSLLSPRSHSMIVSTADWDSNSKRGYELRITDTDGKVEFLSVMDFNGFQHSQHKL